MKAKKIKVLRIMIEIDQFAGRFIHEKFDPTDVYTHRKARILVYTHLFAIGIGGIMQLSNMLYWNGANDQVSVILSILSTICSLLAFRKWGNLLVSGNFLAFAWAIPLAMSVPNTGGIHSDNLLWLITVPLTALLFASWRSGIIWLGFLIGFVCWLMVQNSNQNFLNTITESVNSYYAFSYIFLFIAIFCIVNIFEAGQHLVIKQLSEQKRLLEQQKKAIEEQAVAMQKIDEQLRATNAELENFAYAASHDLKEPLRMIGSYTQLVRRRMQPHLQGDTLEFMGYVTDGINRMQRLLDDLLNYSRLGREEQKERSIDLNNILFVVLHNLMVNMRENDAAIVANDLPKIMGSTTEMIQLFQNLITNSIKFRKTEQGDSPLIEIESREDGDEIVLMFRDNGIGIAPEYHERIFNIFQRLHARGEYEGSGIGLATCKKIVQNIGGRIWLESEEGAGTTFFIAIPQKALAA
jgi:signal transduction histidine kinase